MRLEEFPFNFWVYHVLPRSATSSMSVFFSRHKLATFLVLVLVSTEVNHIVLILDFASIF
jgi:hypothetical protein